MTARKAIEFEDEGVYGFALTLDQVGVHGLHIVVKTESHGQLNATVPLSSDVWPIPEDVKLPALPRKLPIAGLSDVRHGRTLCASFCNQALDFAAPQGQVPQHLGGNQLNALADGDVLSEVVDPKKLGRLNPIERNDLFHHILRLGTSVKAFFPDAAHVIPADVELNDYALERLEASLGIDPAEEDIESTVFVVYRGEGKTLRPAVISSDDLVARDQLDKTKKVGYVIFFSSPNSPELFELGIGLAKEPSYAIVGAVARTATGVKSKLQSQLNKLRGQGRFNDARSIKSGTSSFRSLSPHSTFAQQSSRPCTSPKNVKCLPSTKVLVSRSLRTPDQTRAQPTQFAASRLLEPRTSSSPIEPMYQPQASNLRGR